MNKKIKQSKRQADLDAWTRIVVTSRQAQLQVNLFAAIAGGDWHAIPGLISQGADPNVLGPDGINALHWACATHDHGYAGSYQELVTTLLDHGADINAKCAKGYTPLMHVLMHHADDKQGFTRLLMRAGADPWVVAPRNRDLCYYDDGELFEENVVQEGAILDFLLCCHRHDEPAQQMRWWLVPFLLPELVKDERMAWLVLEALNNGANVNGRDKSGRTALQIAAERQCAEMVRLLTAHGAQDTLESQHVAMRESAELGWAQYDECLAKGMHATFMLGQGHRWLTEWVQSGFGVKEYVFPGHTNWRRMKEGVA